jgi:membrane peptidoglycan carboxypeptidase
VRARLLPPEAFADSTYERKVREIIQSIRLTEAYPGDQGKQDIITAYLNQNFYGNQTYGVKAAARGYFGKSLKDLTLAQFAILAAIPQSPTKFDLMRNAEDVCLDKNPPDPDSDEVCKKSQLEVPLSSEIVQRRNYILDLMKARSTLSGSMHNAAEYDAAKEEPVVIKPQASASWRAAQFVWQVRQGLTSILCPDDPTDCEKVDTGGYRVTTTLDWGMQKIAEKYTYVAARAPHSSNPRKVLRDNKIPARNGAGSSTCAGGTSTTPPRRSWTTGPVRCSRTSAARGIPARATRSSSRSSMSCPTAGASRVHRSSRSTTPSASTTRPTPQARCSWTS